MHLDDPAAYGDETALAQVAQHSVDVDAGKSANLGDIGLSQWQFEPGALAETDRSQPAFGFA